MMAGENCNRMGNFARAITLLTWCVEAAPDNAKAYLLRGAALKDAGEYGRAARDLRRFLSLRPGYVDSLEAHSLLARVYGLQGQAVMEMAELDKLEKKDVTGAYAAKIFIMKRGRERASGRQKS
jgi:Flp pilus assembly protein TadD